jgi:mono/diheme cytochrome c family protein
VTKQLQPRISTRFFTQARKLRQRWLLWFFLACLLGFTLGGATSANAQAEKQSSGKKSTRNNTAAITRGKYLVDGVAVCGQCHTPHDANGGLDRTHWLEGAPLWLQPADHASDWPLQAPRIAGSPPGSDAELITLLTTGIWRDGKPLRPPMPQFHMSRADAVAVIAYLRSLNPRPGD